MGFIESENSKDDDKYILMEDIVSLVQSLDSDKPSLRDTAKFLLRKYVKNYIDDIPFSYVDEICFIRTMTGLYEQANFKRPLLCFLEFVANYDCFDDGISEDNPNWIANNQYSHIYLEKRALADFLQNACGLEDFQDWETNKLKIQTAQPDHKGAELSESTPASTPQQRRAENAQAKIIATLACMYTNTDCGKPYEAAETIRQEWERQTDKLGNPPSKDTIGKYIKQGMELLK